MNHSRILSCLHKVCLLYSARVTYIFINYDSLVKGIYKTNCLLCLIEFNMLAEDKAANPSMATFSARLATFDASWPNHTRAEAEDFSCAGLYFTHKRDCVRCFYCGGGLQNWRLNDDPYLEHAKWYPSCTFIVNKKGLKYVQKARNPQQSMVINGQNLVFNGCTFGGTTVRSVIHHTKVSQATMQKPSCSTTFRFHHPVLNSCSLSKGIIQQPEAAAVIKQLEQLKICKVCDKNNSDVLFLPCAHLCCCTDCSKSLKQCPVCKREVCEKVKTYMS